MFEIAIPVITEYVFIPNHKHIKLYNSYKTGSGHEKMCSKMWSRIAFYIFFDKGKVMKKNNVKVGV